MFLDWKEHYKTHEPYTQMLQNFMRKVQEKWNNSQRAIEMIKYYVKLFNQCKGSSTEFWKKLMPPATINNDNQIIGQKRNPNFPNYLHRKPFMSLIEKIVTSAYEQQWEKSKSDTIEVLNAPQKTKRNNVKVPPRIKNPVLKQKPFVPRAPERALNPSEFRPHDESPFD